MAKKKEKEPEAEEFINQQVSGFRKICLLIEIKILNRRPVRRTDIFGLELAQIFFVYIVFRLIFAENFSSSYNQDSQ